MSATSKRISKKQTDRIKEKIEKLDSGVSGNVEASPNLAQGKKYVVDVDKLIHYMAKIFTGHTRRCNVQFFATEILQKCLKINGEYPTRDEASSIIKGKIYN